MRKWFAFAAAGVVLAGCGADGDSNTDAVGAPIVAGEASSDRYPAVAGIRLLNGNHCTGTRVTPTSLLTARHCTETGVAGKATAFFGSGFDVGLQGPKDDTRIDAGATTVDCAGSFGGVCTSVVENPDFDLALVVLDDVGLQAELEPVGTEGVPSEVTLVGYGDDGNNDYQGFKRVGINRSAVGVVRNGANVAEMTGAGGALCNWGDSGGPLFAGTEGQRLIAAGPGGTTALVIANGLPYETARCGYILLDNVMADGRTIVEWIRDEG